MTTILRALARAVAKDEYPAELLDGFVSEGAMRLASSSDEKYEEVRTRHDLHSFLAECLGVLPEKKADVLRRRFGIGCRPETLAEIAADLGYSCQWVRIMEIEALGRLRRSPVVRQLSEKGFHDRDPRMGIHCEWKSAQDHVEISLVAMAPYWPAAMRALAEAAVQITRELGETDLRFRRRRLEEIVHLNLEWEVPRIRTGARSARELFHVTFHGEKPFSLGRQFVAKVRTS